MILLDIDPNVVKPGWTPLIILIILAGAVVLLYISLRRQVRRINVPGSTPSVADDDSTSAAETADQPAAEVEPVPDASVSDAPPRPSSSPTG